MVHQVVVVGSGPAGLTAAIYAGRAGLAPVVVASSVEAGGDLMKTTEVENFPGFPDGVQGPDLMALMQKQAERFGASVLYDDVVALELRDTVKVITLGGGSTLRARAVILATGSEYRRLGLPDEERLTGHGVSWCATCDGFFFRDQDVAVVGGGDSAMEEATFLSRFARRVYVVHRSTRLRASAVMQERARQDPKIEFLLDRTVTALLGGDKLTGIRTTDVTTGRTDDLEVSGLFVAIGSDPRTALVREALELTPHRTVATRGRSTATSLPGVFAAGDVADHTYRQAVTAAGSGAAAALDAQHYLDATSDDTLAPPEGAESTPR